jgi:hypothetical protein
MLLFGAGKSLGPSCRRCRALCFSGSTLEETEEELHICVPKIPKDFRALRGSLGH